MGGGSRPGARPPAGGLQTAAGEGPGWSDRGRVPTRARRPAARRPSEAARRPGWTGTALPRRERRRPPRTGPSPDGSGLDPRRPGCIGVPGAPAAGGVAVASLSPAVLTGSRVGRHTPRRPPRRPAPAAPQLPVPGQPGNVPAHLGSATSRSQPVDAHDTQEPHAGQVGRPLLVACQSNSTRLSCLPKWSTSAVPVVKSLVDGLGRRAKPRVGGVDRFGRHRDSYRGGIGMLLVKGAGHGLDVEGRAVRVDRRSAHLPWSSRNRHRLLPTRLHPCMGAGRMRRSKLAHADKK